MPELPEVETTRRGIAPFLESAEIRRLVVRNRKLRWPVPPSLEDRVAGRTIRFVGRRGKYLLLGLDGGGLLLHLGMSGSLRVLSPPPPPPGPHDHFDLIIGDGRTLRFRDPRRFGSLLWQPGDVHRHSLLENLGVEPLSAEFTGDGLWMHGRRRRTAIKNILMNGRVVVGVGNIYASEALFEAGVHPGRAGNRISRHRYQALVSAVRNTLERAIEQGGTTLRDFTGAEGNPGYFHQSLRVYGREGEPCERCRVPVRKVVTGQRATYYCPGCQH